MTTERGMLEACPPEDSGCDPKMPRWELCLQSSVPLGSQPGTAPWRLCTCRGGVSRGCPGPLQRSGPSFSTRQTPVGLLASEMAYFSTVFKTEVTVSSQVREAYRTLASSSGAQISGTRQHVRVGGGGRAAGPSARVPAERGLETPGPCSRDGGQPRQCHRAETRPPRGGATGRWVVWAWGGDHSGTFRDPVFAATWGTGHN